MTLADSDNSAVIRSDRRGRLLVRAEQRALILDAFDASHLSAMAFSRQHGLSYSTFATWIQKRRKGIMTPAPSVALARPLQEDIYQCEFLRLVFVVLGEFSIFVFGTGGR